MLSGLTGQLLVKTVIVRPLTVYPAFRHLLFLLYFSGISYLHSDFGEKNALLSVFFPPKYKTCLYKTNWNFHCSNPSKKGKAEL